MNVIVRHKIMSIEDFLAWEARQEQKYEFDGFEPVAMAGGSRNHARIQRNLAMAVGSRLRGSPCEFLGSDMKLVTATRCRYPDGQVVCGAADGDATFTTTPSVLFEVTSPSSDARDHVEKAAEYHAIASLQHYVVLEQDRMVVTVSGRDGNGWRTEPVGADRLLKLPALNLAIPLAELYEGVLLTP